MSGDRERSVGPRGVVRWVRAAFAATVLGSAGFAAAYSAGGNTQLLGIALGIAFGGLAVGLAVWSRGLLPSGGFVEERPMLGRQRPERARLIGSVAGPIRRRGLLAPLIAAGTSVGLALLFPLRSLLEFRKPHPFTTLRHTAWGSGAGSRGRRLVTPEGVPVRAADITPGTIQIVVPEGRTGDGDAPAFVVRLDPARLRKPPPAATAGGIAAFSLLCTHAGCPVGSYEEGTGRMLCPCHQSGFDLWNGARPDAGPAARPLPGLPIEVDGQGFLRATGDFTAPPGGGFWSQP